MSDQWDFDAILGLHWLILSSDERGPDDCVHARCYMVFVIKKLSFLADFDGIASQFKISSRSKQVLMVATLRRFQLSVAAKLRRACVAVSLC